MMILTHDNHDLPGSGERLEARNERLTKIIKGVLFGVGVASGAAIGYHVASSDFDLSAPWPPAISLAIAITYLLAMAFGSIFLSRLTDEVEKARSYKAAALAGAVYMLVYPLWFLLWKGGFVTEPAHWALFLLFWLSLLFGTVYYRFR